jgi:hypothetical protein
LRRSSTHFRALEKFLLLFYDLRKKLNDVENRKNHEEILLSSLEQFEEEKNQFRVTRLRRKIEIIFRGNF